MTAACHACPHCRAAVPLGQGATCPSCGKPLPAGWYYAKGKQRLGPVSAAELRALAGAGTISPTDMVLRAGTQKWLAAGKVKGLFPEPVAAPAVPPEAAEVPTITIELVSRRLLLAEAQVVPEGSRCVQCGCCSYNCPIGIDVRAHAWRNQPIHDSHCLTCGECVKRCPRGVLSFERLPLFTEER